MTNYKLAELPKWASKVTKIGHALVSQSTNDLLLSIEIVPGITRGGSRVKGTIPRDLDALANSLQSSIRGGTAITGSSSYVLIAGQMRAGSVGRFMWGGTVAPYARAVHYGANGVKGTYWVDVAASNWPKTVRGALRKIKAAIQ